MYLPLTDDVKQPDPAVAITTLFDSGNETILLAEDDELTRTLSKEFLEEFGYTVIEARDGIQAVEKFREHQLEIKLVILDAVMPGMKGMDVYHEIKKMKPGGRVLFCSGYNADVMEDQGRLDRNLHFIAKPFMPKELLMKIREVIADAI